MYTRAVVVLTRLPVSVYSLYAVNKRPVSSQSTSILAVNEKDVVRNRPHSCTTCSKRFTSRSALGTHSKIHTGERQHSCTNCDKHFINLSDLLKHKLRHTNKRPYACLKCIQTGWSSKDSYDYSYR